MGFRLVLISLFLFLASGPQALAGEPLYPRALMNWMVEGSFHALIVDKSEQRLTVWKIKDGEPSMVESFRCSTGENEGDKWVRGDMKTPEGVYLFCSVIDGRRLPSKYGYWAFTTDYPNFVDRRRGKSGDGIWLHGRDKPLADKPDSNGCVALENQDLVKVSRYIRLQDTPLIVVSKTLMAPRSEIMDQERKLRDFIESWRQSWESRDVDDYMNYYSPNFQSLWLDFALWKEKKRKLIQRYKKIRVRLGDVFLYRQDGIVTAVFSQTYVSDGFRSSGLKALYITEDGGKFSIYAEDYHQPVDDQFPVRVLLARTGVDLAPPTDKPLDFKIRLVSTDEPEQTSSGDIESPRPSAPGTGVVLERLANGPAAGVTEGPPTEMSERLASGGAPERLVVARLVPSYTPTELPLAARPKEQRVAALDRGPVEEHSIAAEAPRRKSDSMGFSVAIREPLLSNRKSSDKKVDAPLRSTEAKPAEVKKNRDEKELVVDFLDQWKKAWEQKDLDRYVKMYHPRFEGGKQDYKAFLKLKRNFFRKYRTIRVEIDRVETRKENGRVLVKFLQSFQGDDYSDKGWKSMVLASGKGDSFRILEEQWSPAEGISANSNAKAP